ncbi:hypothetical protein R77591_04189 [Ralstonia mannitolilytica]|uniref:Uncharacterized protein n=1 Tax=Ralstonia mannitolilytica TaxID=105219 RepID=A0AAD2EN46_9RALS|nr:hypothetical protein R77591_04189 [Ralstonia mannitolilytica]
MARPRVNRLSTALVSTLPERVFTRSGSSFDPRKDVWEWADGPFNARIDFRRYRHGFEAFVPSLKRKRGVMAVLH